MSDRFTRRTDLPDVDMSGLLREVDASTDEEVTELGVMQSKLLASRRRPPLQ